MKRILACLLVLVSSQTAVCMEEESMRESSEDTDVTAKKSKLLALQRHNFPLLTPQLRHINAVMEAISEGNVAQVKSILKEKVNINCHSEGESGPTTPLCEAVSGAKQSSRKIVKLLLEHGADRNLADLKGYTPLAIAAEEGHKKMVKILLKYGADVNAVSGHNVTPLYYALSNGHNELAELLIKKGADIDLALFELVEDSNYAGCSFLMARGANPETVIYDEKTGERYGSSFEACSDNEIRQILEHKPCIGIDYIVGSVVAFLIGMPIAAVVLQG